MKTAESEVQYNIQHMCKAGQKKGLKQVRKREIREVRNEEESEPKNKG